MTCILCIAAAIVILVAYTWIRWWLAMRDEWTDTDPPEGP